MRSQARFIDDGCHKNNNNNNRGVGDGGSGGSGSVGKHRGNGSGVGDEGGSGGSAREVNGAEEAACDGEGSGFVFGGSRASIALRGVRGGRAKGRGGARGRESSTSTTSTTSTASTRRGAPQSGPAAVYREAYFTPTSGALQGKLVAGVQLFPLGVNRALFREGVELLLAMKRLYPSFGWREQTQAAGAAASSRLKVARRRAEAAAVFMSPSKLGSLRGGGEGGTPGLRSEASAGLSSAAGGAAAAGAQPFTRESRVSDASSRSSLEKPSQVPSIQPTERRPPFIDLLTGSGRLREALDASVEAGAGAGRGAVEELFASWEEELQTFVELRRGFLLYD
jgi:hypothetical protein